MSWDRHRAQQLYTGIVVAFLLLAFPMNGYAAAAGALVLLAAGLAAFPDMRRRGTLAAILAVTVAVAIVLTRRALPL